MKDAKQMHLSSARDGSIDSMRGIGIILVIIGHTHNIFTNFIYQFHMPLFFFISGLCFKEKKCDKPALYFKRKIIRLWLPYVLYNWVFLSLHNVFLIQNFINGEYYTIKDFFIQFIKIATFANSEKIGGALWFLTSLFTIDILMCVMKIIQKRKGYPEYYNALIIGLLAIIGFSVNLPRLLHTSFVAWIFYYIGHKISLPNTKDFFLRSPILILAALIITIIGSFINHSSLSLMNFSSVKEALLFLIPAFTGIIIMIYISNLKCIEESKSMHYIGKNTMPIIALHLLGNRFVNVLQVTIYGFPVESISFQTGIENGFWWIIYVLFGLVFPLTANLLIIGIENIIKIQINNFINSKNLRNS